MPNIIPVVHDFICPWCYLGWIQARKLTQEFGVEFDWIAAELYPRQLPYDDSPSTPEPANKPKTPTRFGFICIADGITMPKVAKPPRMRSFNAHAAVEFAKQYGKGQALIDVLYPEFWEKGTDINNVEVLIELVKPFNLDLADLRKAIEEDRFRDKVIEFDEPAYEQGIYNVPTFFIGDQRLAEQPFSVVRKALQAHLGEQDTTPLYADVEFPHLPNRPYIFINMVATVDGKIITGERGEPVWDLGSKIDHATMHRLEAKADTVLTGATSIRATGKNWNPKTETRVAVTRSGNLPYDFDFFTSGKPYILAPATSSITPPKVTEVITTSGAELDWQEAMRELFQRGVRVINCLGGSDINAQLFRENLVDEIFITIAPKIKLGELVPTIADGVPLAREEVQNYELLSCQQVGNEVFLRYRRRQK